MRAVPHPARSALIRIGGSAVILALLAWLLPVKLVVQEMRSVDGAVWFTVLAAFLVVQFVGAVKFHLVLRSAGAGLPFAVSVRCAFAALFGNVFLPSIIGGDVISIGLAMTHSANRTAVALGAFVNRMLDFAALATVTMVGAILLHASLSEESRRVFASVVLGLIAVAMAAAVVLRALLRRRHTYRIRRVQARLRSAARAMRADPSAVVTGFALALAMQGVLVSLVAWLGHASSLPLPLPVWFFAWPLSKLAAIAPISIGGIGAREAAFAAIALPFGVPPTQAVATGLLYEAVSVTGGLVAGAISWTIARRWR